MSIESFEHNGKTVKIYQDQDASSPREGYDVGIMVCEHRDYYLGDEPGRGRSAKIEEYDDLKRAMLHYGRENKLALFERYCRIYHGTTVVLPLYLLDHSGLWMRTGTFMEDPGGWDTSMVGFILDTAKTRETTGVRLEDVEKALRSEVKVYSQYLEGDVYGYVIEDEDGDEEDSCWGFFGIDYAMQSARDAAGYTCVHCGHSIARWIGPIVDPREDAERDGVDWTHDLCKVCNGPTAWGKEGEYHLKFDVTLTEPHKADGVRRRACPSGDTVAEPAQYVGSYE